MNNDRLPYSFEPWTEGDVMIDIGDRDPAPIADEHSLTRTQFHDMQEAINLGRARGYAAGVTARVAFLMGVASEREAAGRMI